MNIDRKDIFDYAKGIGIILVVFGHVERGLLNANIPMDKNFYDLIDSIIYSFHMPLFFFLSGFFFLKSLEKHGGLKLIQSKSETVLYPYVIFSLIQGLIEIGLASYTNGSTTLGQVLSLLWQPRAQFWFLYVLFAVFLASVVLYRRSETGWFMWILGVAFALYFFGAPINVYVINLFAKFFVFFAAGVSVGRLMLYDLAIQGRTTMIFLFAAVVFVGSQYIYHGMFGFTVNSNEALPLLFLALGGIFFVIALSSLLVRFKQRWLLYIGRHSMEIYLIHILAASGGRIVLQRFFGLSDVTLHIVFGMLLGIGIPILVPVWAPKCGFGWIFSPPRKLLFWTVR